MKKRLKKSIHTLKNDTNPSENLPLAGDKQERILPGSAEWQRAERRNSPREEVKRDACGDVSRERESLIRNIINDDEIDDFDDSPENLVRLLDGLNTNFMEPPNTLREPEKMHELKFKKGDLDRLFEAFTGINPLPEIGPGIPDSLPIDHHLPELLKRLTNEDDLKRVTKIKLKVVSLEMSLSRMGIFLPNLVELDLEGSCLLSLRDLGGNFSGLLILKVPNCGIRSLDGTIGLSNLIELHASDNLIDDLGCSLGLSNLEFLDISRNQIKSIYSVVFLRPCEKLRTLKIEGNPCINQLNYIEQLQGWLPHLTEIDNQKISNLHPDEDQQQEHIPSTEPLFERKSPAYGLNDTCKARRELDRKFKKKFLLSSSDESIPDDYKNLRKKTDQIFEGINNEAMAFISKLNIEPQASQSDTTQLSTPQPPEVVIPGTSFPSTQILCGNLTQAMSRSTRSLKKKERHMHQESKKVSIISSTSSDDEILEDIARRKKPVNLIDASKRFRNKYQEYRQKNRSKWQKEESEDLVEGDTESS